VDDVYRKAPLAGVVDDGPWFDIGTPQRYLEASGGSTIGARSVVEGTLRNSVVWDDCRIAAGVVLEECIVAHGVQITHPAELRRSIICRDHPAIPAEYRREHGLVISPF
jgi:NDP-sugar pyrophosphorylase family protein